MKATCILNKIWILLIALTLTQCLGGSGSTTVTNPDPDPNVNTITYNLAQFESCEDLISDVHQTIATKAEAYYDAYFDCGDGDGSVDTIVMEDSDSGDSSSDSSSGTTYTDTNTQEEEVDESDIIKTDGTYIYVGTSSGVDIFQAWPVESFERVAIFDAEQSISQLYLVDERLVALSNTFDSDLGVNLNIIRIIDVSDPTDPQLVRTKKVQGYYSKSRMVDGILHLVAMTSFSTVSYVRPDYDYEDYSNACDGNASAAQELSIAVSTAKSEVQEEIGAIAIEDVVPVAGDDIDIAAVDCTSIYKDDSTDQTNFVGILSIDVTEDDGEEQISYIKGRSNEIYASTQSIYLAAKDPDADHTHIHKFTLGNNDKFHQYFGSNGVAGHVYSSLAMSEADDIFRIATTVGSVSRSADTEVSSSLYTLNAASSDMTILGSITEIAPGEQIYAARFIGDTGYLVTYQKVDPLFVIDVSDATNPQIVGELEMPGYSTYLHPLDEDHIIGLGKDAEEVDGENFSWYQGLKLAIFDVGDATNPNILEDLIIGSRGTDSAASYDHHAFTFEESTGTLALPLTLYEGGVGGSDYGDFQYYGVHLYTLTVNGISIEQEIALPDDASYPKRTLLMSEDGARYMYVLGDDDLHLIELAGDYSILATEEVTNDYSYIYEY